MRPNHAATRFAAGRGIFVRGASMTQIQAPINDVVAATAQSELLTC